MASSRLDILLNAKDQTGGAFRSVQSNIRGLDDAAKSASGGISGLAAAIGAVGLTVFAQQAAAAASAMAEQATQMRRAEFAALSLAGSQAQLNDLLTTYQRVTGGLVTTGEALQQVARLQAIGFADTADELERFVTAARGAAAATGQNLDYIIGQLQLSIANQSTMRLDQLGLSVSEVNERVADLTSGSAGLSREAAYQQAILDALNEKYGDIAVSSIAAATGSERLGTAMRQASENIASGIGPQIDAISGKIADLINWLEIGSQAQESAFVNTNTLVELNNRVLDLANQWQNASAIMQTMALGGDPLRIRGAASAVDELREQLVRAGEQYNITAEILGAALLDLDQLDHGVIVFEKMGEAAEDAGQKITIVTGSVDELVRVLNNELFAASQKAFFAIEDAIDRASNAAGKLFAQNLGAGAGLARMEDVSNELESQVGLWRILNYENDDIINVLLPAYIANMNEVDRAVFDTTEQTSLLKKAAADAKAEFDNLVNSVSGVLQEALNLDVGVDPADFLPREDAVNENARRLADIMVNGFKGQNWLEEFKNEVPDIYQALAESGDPKTAAAQMLKEFELGLRPELIDKEAAKERVRQMLLGDQNLAELAQEIAAEIAAEMPNVGKTGLQSVVNQALGLQGNDIASGLAAGQAYAEGAKNAVAEAAPGTAMVRALDAELRLPNNIKLLTDAGTAGGSAWGSGFLATVESGVPPALIDLLVRLITPGVQAGLHTEASLTGAGGGSTSDK